MSMDGMWNRAGPQLARACARDGLEIYCGKSYHAEAMTATSTTDVYSRTLRIQNTNSACNT